MSLSRIVYPRCALCTDILFTIGIRCYCKRHHTLRDKRLSKPLCFKIADPVELDRRQDMRIERHKLMRRSHLHQYYLELKNQYTDQDRARIHEYNAFRWQIRQLNPLWLIQHRLDYHKRKEAI
jgi:hypothetical protein